MGCASGVKMVSVWRRYSFFQVVLRRRALSLSYHLRAREGRANRAEGVHGKRRKHASATYPTSIHTHTHIHTHIPAVSPARVLSRL